MLIIILDISIFQKDHPLEVYSPSQSLSGNCRIQGKVSHFTEALTSQSCLTRALVFIRPPKAYGTPAIQIDAKSLPTNVLKQVSRRTEPTSSTSPSGHRYYRERHAI